MSNNGLNREIHPAERSAANTNRWIMLSLILTVTLASSRIAAAEVASSNRKLARHERRPVALVASVDGQRLFVGNRASGSISVIDRESATVTREYHVAKELSDLVAFGECSQLLAVDSEAHELVLLDSQAGRLRVVRRISVASYPAKVWTDGQRVAVTSVWSRRLTLVDNLASDDGAALKRRYVDLPFAPRELVALAGERLAVADAFGGCLAIVTSGGEISAVHELPGHQLRGLLIDDAGHLQMVHQQLFGRTATMREYVHWGGVMTNLLRTIPQQALSAESLAWEQMPQPLHLGRPGNGAADPAAAIVTGRGAMIIALAGTDEIKIRPTPREPFVRRDVGARPTALAYDPIHDTAYVANTLDDTVSVVDVARMQVRATIELGPQPPPSLADQGERLFFAARLTHDNWYSCQSCHTEGHTNGLLNDNASDGHYGAPKRVLSLLGAADSKPWAWSGRAASLAGQVEKSVLHTMQGDSIAPPEVRALVAYIESLPAPVSLNEARGQLNAAAVRRGKEIFRSRGCAECHRQPVYTTPERYDVGIHDELGTKAFNPPSLRGASQLRALFHDNRARSLEEVLGKFRHQLDDPLTDRDRNDLLHFLRSL